MKKFDQIIYLLFYGLIASNLLTPLYFILYLPSLILWQIEGIKIETPLSSVFLLQLTVSLLLWLVYYLIINSTKKPREFFFLTVAVLNISYAYTFLPVLANQQVMPLFLLIEPLLVVFSLVLTGLWQKIWLKQTNRLGWILVVPFLVDVLFVLLESPATQTGLIFKNFLNFGNWLKAVTGGCLNLFFLDFTGFAVLYMNTINMLLVSSFLFLKKKPA